MFDWQDKECDEIGYSGIKKSPVNGDEDGDDQRLVCMAMLIRRFETEMERGVGEFQVNGGKSLDEDAQSAAAKEFTGGIVHHQSVPLVAY